MGSFNARSMVIRLLESFCTFSLTRSKKRLHLLFGVQGQAAPSCSRTAGPSGTDLTIALGKLHLDQRFASILNRCPTRTDPTLWTDHPLCVPIDGEMREVVAGLRLIPVGLECRANQINSRVELRLYRIGDRDIARVHKMVIWDQFLFSQIGMDRCEIGRAHV